MVSTFELFRIGLGPSSSHTVGPMRAALAFVTALGPKVAETARVQVRLYGSLAWTGAGHGTDRAVLLGLAGEAPETVDPAAAAGLLDTVRASGRLRLAGGHSIAFAMERDLVFDTLAPTPVHPNTLGFEAWDGRGTSIGSERWCSVGGGFVVREAAGASLPETAGDVAHPFRNARELLEEAARHGLSIAALVRVNEAARRTPVEIEAGLDRILDTMMDCIDRGMRAEGRLPGGLPDGRVVRRRAAGLAAGLDSDLRRNVANPARAMEWVSVFAIAVNEENASGGRVVTAPTNGAAGVVPAVLRYYRDMISTSSREGMHDFLLTATAIGTLFKRNASISGAEVGCQGEVGVACSMAAAGLAAALGASNAQIENAAEIGMEHHLGMTCDPVGGLVQIPCIERNAFGAVKAINAASLAMRGDGEHVISLDQVIAVMRQTGADMQSKYKETSLGGLAVNFIEC